MCIWDVAPEDRRCEYCSYFDGCEVRVIVKREPVEQRAKFYSDLMSKIVGSDILCSSRLQPFVWARNMVAYKLHQDGYTNAMIGFAIGRDHSTITYCVGKVKDMLNNPGMYKNEIDVWEEFNKNIELCAKKD